MNEFIMPMPEVIHLDFISKILYVVLCFSLCCSSDQAYTISYGNIIVDSSL